MLNWFELFSARDCPSCLSKIEQPRHGLRRAFCARCHASLPYRLGLHMDRALHSRWFVRWWRVGVRILRTEQLSDSRERKPVSAALAPASTGQSSTVQTKKACG